MLSIRTRKKLVSSVSLFTSILLIFSPVALVYGYRKTYEFGEDCSSNTNDLYEDDELYVEYNGKTVGFFCDSFKFSGRGVRLSDEYSVCVTPLYFNDSECAVEINIKTSNTGVSEHKITCSENKNTQYCGPQDETLYIEFDDRFGRGTNKASFKLKITAKKEFKYTDKRISYSSAAIGALILGVIGGTAIITVFAAVCCCCLCRWKPSRRRVFKPDPPQLYPSTAIPYVIYSGQTQQSKMTTPSDISSPVVCTMALYPSPQGNVSPRTTDNKLSDQHLSYGDLKDSKT